MRYIFVFLTVALLTCPVNVLASFTDRYNATYLTIRNGMPNNFIDDIYQDSNGFVWIASQGGGLVRYDGYAYSYYGIGHSDYPLKSNSCRNICEDDFRRLWVAFEEYTDVLDLRLMSSCIPPCASVVLNHKLKGILAENCIRTYNDGHQHIWIITTAHIYMLSFDEQGSICGILQANCIPSTPDVAIEYIDGIGVWIAFGGTLHRYVVPNGPVRGIAKLKEQASPSHVAIPKNTYITAILRQGQKIWLGTNQGLMLCGREIKEFHHSADPRSISHEFISCLSIAPDGKLLVGTLAGVDIYDGHGFEHWNTSSSTTPLGNNFVNCILSKNGLVWVGTEAGGITALSPRHLDIINYTHGTDVNSISPNAVNAMYIDPNATVWVGTVEGGLNRTAWGTGHFTHYTTSNSSLSHNSVSALTADTHGNLWIGTWAGGVNVINMNGRSGPRPLHVDRRYADVLRFIGALAYDPYNDALWIGSNDGIFYYDIKNKTISDPFPGNREIRGCIGSIIDRDGVLWMGCIAGVVRVSLKNRANKQFRARWMTTKLDNPESGIIEKISCFCQTQDGTLWLGSNVYGLYRRQLDGKGHETFKVYTANDGLPSNCIKGIAEAPDGTLWIATANGLSQMSPKRETFANYSEEDGLVCSQFYWNGALAGPGGWILLGSEKGLTAINSRHKKAEVPGKLTFTHVKVNNQDVRTGSKYLEKDISCAERISLHESDKSLDIDFATLSYMGAHQGSYSYRLKGYNEDWIILQSGLHSAHYTSLPAGKYLLEVRYLPAVGNGKPQIIALHVQVSPYFWKSWWFILLCLLAAVYVIRWLYHRRIENMKRYERELILMPIKKALNESDTPQLLQKRIESILGNHKKYQESQEKSIEADKRTVEHSQKPFVDRLMEITERNYTDADFGVTELCEAMGMSRALLSKKVNAAVGLSTNQFIRNYRLDVARKLITKNPGGRNITEIAFSVGFNDPKYFTRCFTKLYGVSPSAYMAK